MSFPSFFVEMGHPRRLHHPHFGWPLTHEPILPLTSPTLNRHYYRPWKQLEAMRSDAGSTITTEKTKFHVTLDVQHFGIDELTVKTADGLLIIEGNHEEKEDEHGWISRKFTRKYPLPKGCLLDSVIAKLSSDGVLNVIVPLVNTIGASERVVPIVHTGSSKMQEGCKADGDSANTSVENGQ